MQEVCARAKKEKEAIHSGHFMVSHFEAEEQDDEDDVAVPVPETEVKNSLENIPDQFNIPLPKNNQENGKTNQQLSIETNLSKLFQCMSLAYRQKLTSPKWNRFRGIKLRWKDKIRLNNVIWRCWHMQFIMKQNTLICQFASPLDVDTHNKPEAIVLEGKYWKRKLQAVTAEYKKWRMYYRNQSLGCTAKENIGNLLDIEVSNWNSQSNDGLNMMLDADYMGLMSDTLFSTISNQPFVFPDSREIAKAGYADFIQPSLGPLQPNLDDFMDTFEPLNVPEEQSTDNINNPMGWEYSDIDMMGPTSNMQVLPNAQPMTNQYTSLAPTKMTGTDCGDEMILGLPDVSYELPAQQPNISYQSTVISKANVKQKTASQSRTKGKSQKAQAPMYKETINYTSFPVGNINKSSVNMVDTMQPTQPNLNTRPSSEGYKFPMPTHPDLKFTRQSVRNEFVVGSNQTQMQMITAGSSTETRLNKDVDSGLVKQDTGAVSRNKVNHRRQRSRSTSRDQSQAPQRPPLLTAVSDPAIINTNSSVLLTQLLTSNNHLRPPEKTQGNNSALVKREEANTNHPVAILPASAKPVTTLIITAPSQQAPTSGPILLSSVNQAIGSPVMDHSSRSMDSPESPMAGRSMLDSPGSKGDSTPPHREQRRVGHIHAEQKRRYNIKNGFEMIHSLIPHLSQNPNTKLSKAAMLQKGADYIRQLTSERNQLKEEMDSLRYQIECLNTSISNCQSMLPATGAPVSRRQDNRMQQMFDEYVRNRTLENWKFWIFSLMIKPLLTSYNNFVSTSSLEDLYRSTLLWVEQHCTLVDLRPVFFNSLRNLSKKTDILEHPARLPEEARQAVNNPKPVYP